MKIYLYCKDLSANLIQNIVDKVLPWIVLGRTWRPYYKNEEVRIVQEMVPFRQKGLNKSKTRCPAILHAFFVDELPTEPVDLPDFIGRLPLELLRKIHCLGGWPTSAVLA